MQLRPGHEARRDEHPGDADRHGHVDPSGRLGDVLGAGHDRHDDDADVDHRDRHAHRHCHRLCHRHRDADRGAGGHLGLVRRGCGRISSLTGTWLVHDLVVEIHADGTGQLRSWGCYPGTVMVCQVVSDVTVTPVGASGARLTVVRTFALDENGHVAPVPAGVDLAQQKQQVGDYSVLQPFTAATWPYSTPLTTASQRAVYSFLSASKGQPLGDPKNELARMCRTTGSNPPRAVDPTYCGA